MTLDPVDECHAATRPAEKSPVGWYSAADRSTSGLPSLGVVTMKIATLICRLAKERELCAVVGVAGRDVIGRTPATGRASAGRRVEAEMSPFATIDDRTVGGGAKEWRQPRAEPAARIAQRSRQAAIRGSRARQVNAPGTWTETDRFALMSMGGHLSMEVQPGRCRVRAVRRGCRRGSRARRSRHAAGARRRRSRRSDRRRSYEPPFRQFRAESGVGLERGAHLLQGPMKP